MENKNQGLLPDYEKLFAEEAEHSRDGASVISKLLRQNSPKILLSAIMFAIKDSIGLISPIVTSNIINALVSPGDDLTTVIIKNAVLLVVLYILHIPGHAIYSKYVDNMLRTISAGLRRTIIRKLQHLSITYHKEIESGRVQSKFIRDIEAVEMLNNQIIKNVVPTVTMLLINVVIVLAKNWIVAAFFALVIPAEIIFVKVFRKKLADKNSLFRRENEMMATKVTEMMNMIPVTKAHGLEEEELIKLEDGIRRLRMKALDVDRLNAYFASSLHITMQMFNLLNLVFSAFLASKGIIDVGDIVLFQSYFSTIVARINILVAAVPEITKGIESVRSVSEIMFSNDVEDDKNKIKLRYVHGHLKFDKVCYRYPGTSEDTIKELELEVRPGECIAFVGGSGSGKSTIMNMIIGFLHPTSGQYLIDGKPVESLAMSDYRHFISVVPQNSILMTGTIRDNITYGMPGVIQKRLEEVLELANINEFLPTLPNGVDTVIGENGGKLSGGQKQRICIARALIRDPKILILDEATSALDNISEFHVQKAISELIKNRTTFIVAHRLSTIRDADRIVVMEQGRCVEIGTYDELMEKKGKFYELKTLSDVNVEG
ncbi:MAG: ABC transporter ATP-binding protein [Ruminococcaceae bacterium]|nr:ABC transporter ATP-binding protein [Oscillospiraceae bacterium]